MVMVMRLLLDRPKDDPTPPFPTSLLPFFLTEKEKWSEPRV
jgi:hypothetical protein